MRRDTMVSGLNRELESGGEQSSKVCHSLRGDLDFLLKRGEKS